MSNSKRNLSAEPLVKNQIFTSNFSPKTKLIDEEA